MTDEIPERYSPPSHGSTPKPTGRSSPQAQASERPSCFKARREVSGLPQLSGLIWETIVRKLARFLPWRQWSPSTRMAAGPPMESPTSDTGSNSPQRKSAQAVSDFLIRRFLQMNTDFLKRTDSVAEANPCPQDKRRTANGKPYFGFRVKAGKDLHPVQKSLMLEPHWRLRETG